MKRFFFFTLSGVNGLRNCMLVTIKHENNMVVENGTEPFLLNKIYHKWPPVEVMDNVELLP